MNDLEKQIIEFEIFTILLNVDESILLLSPHVEKFGFIIKHVGPEEIESRFSKLFIGGKYIMDRDIKIGNQFVSSQLYHSLKGITILDYQIIKNEGLFVIQSLSKNNYTLDNSCIDPKETSAPVLEYRENTLLPFLSQLKLFKQGHPYEFITFSAETKTNNIPFQFKFLPQHDYHKDFILTDSESAELGGKLIQGFKIKDFLQVAWNSFLISFKTLDPNIKFLTLFLALESICSRIPSNDIGFRISRGTAFLLKGDTPEGKELYFEIKKLWNIRSEVSHEGVSMEKVLKNLSRLEDIVRYLIASLNNCRFNDIKELGKHIDENAPGKG